MSFSFPDFLIARRLWLLALALLLVAVGADQARRLTFDRRIENMFPPDSPLLEGHRRLQRAFGGNEIVLAVYADDQLFDRSGAGMRRLTHIRHEIGGVPGVKAVLSIDQPLGPDLILQQTRLAQRARKLFAGFTHSADGRTASIVCMLIPTDQTPVPRETTIDRLREVVGSLPDGLSAGYLVGEPALVVDGFRYVERDGARLQRWSALLLGLTIAVCFRSLRWVLVPVAVVLWAVWMTKGLLAALNLQLSMVSSMLNAVVMVVAVATMVHVIVRYRVFRTQGYLPMESLRRTMALLWLPVTWSCLTDAAGFFSLTVSDVGPVHDFGVMMAIGCLMVWVAVFLVVPALALWGSRDADPQHPWGGRAVLRQLDRLLRLVHRRPNWLLAGLVVLIVLAVTGVYQLDVETDFTRNFRRDSPIARAYDFVEDRLGGAGIGDVIVSSPETLDAAFLERAYRLGRTFEKSDVLFGRGSVTRTFSLADVLFDLSPVELHDKPSWFQVSLVRSGLLAMRGWMPEFYDALYGRDPLDGKFYYRFMLRVRERQGAEQKRLVLAELERLSRQEFPDAQVTGYFVLLTHLVDSVLKDQWRTAAVALLGIALLMTVAFRSVTLALIALVPNTLPVLVVMGVMGWLSVWLWPELKMNMGTAMIAAVSLGLSIDSSIHYIVAFQREEAAGRELRESLRAVQSTVGQAMTWSTLSLCVGFTVLATSQFVPTVYFGAMVSLAMLGGLIGNLIGLPLLLSLRHRMKTGSGLVFARMTRNSENEA